MKSRIVICLTLVAIFMLMATSANALPPRVNVMPGNMPGKVYPYTWPGRTLTIWGNVHDGTPPYTYVWDFGDGTPTVSGAVVDPKYISVIHSYATMGPKLAVLTVTDASLLSDKDTVEIEVVTMDFQARVNAAIEDGLRYLYLNQWGDGRWSDGCDATTTALAVLAFENAGHLPINDFDKDIYAEYVKAGLDYLTSILSTQAMSVQGAGDPEEIVPGNTDNNGIGVYPQSCHTGYETGMVMMAMVGAGPLGSAGPDLVAPNGPPGIVGRTYRELVVDMVDYCAWGQTEPSQGDYRGGWRYDANFYDSDNSVSQWPPIGMEAAETNWGISSPGFVKSELELWINYSQINGGYWDGAFWYQPSWWPIGPMAVTGAGLCEMAYCDIPQSDSRFQRALSALERGWNTEANKGFNYAMYAIAKGCRIAVDDAGEVSEINFIGSIEWYPDYATFLLGVQQPDGRFPATVYGFGAYMDHSWALLVLQPVWIPCLPVAVIDGPSSVPPDFPFDLDGSDSYIYGGESCPNEIVEWLWDFDKSDGYDWNNPDAIGSEVVNPGYTLPLGIVADTYVVTLRVADDSDPAKTDIAEHTIIVSFENHPPIADPGGPYAGKVDELICFDGTGSHDPDPGDSIISYSWDIDGDGNFGDCSDPVCCHSWPYVYSGYVGLVVTDSYGATSDTQQAYVTVWTSLVDVGIDSSDIFFSAPYPKPGDTIIIYAPIYCDSASDPVSSVEVRFYDGDPDIALHQINDDQIIYDMMAGDVETVQVEWVVPDTLTHEIYVRVDPDGELEEYNERNNEAFKIISAGIRMSVALDIKPQSCPNPLNTKDKGLLPVAILGADTFDVMTVDPATVRLEGVAPIRWSYEDVSRPVSPRHDTCECTTFGADGFKDLTFKFDHQAIVAALGTVQPREVRVLTLTGMTYDSIPIMGKDCVVIIHKGLAKPSDEMALEFGLGPNYPNPFNPITHINFTLPTLSSWNLKIYNVAGQLVKSFEGYSSGQVSVIWDGKDSYGTEVASGIYFYKLNAGNFTSTKKMVLAK